MLFSFILALKTFVPFAGGNFEEGVLRSLMCLDDKRLGKQRVETFQIWKMVRGFPFDNTKRPADHASLKPAAWSRHPAVHQWHGYADALALYLIKNIEIWEQRVSPITGRPFDNTRMHENLTKWRIAYHENDDQKPITYESVKVPHWWSDPRIHDSDKGILYRKDKHYSMFRKYAMVYEQYVWPSQISAAGALRFGGVAGLITDESPGKKMKIEVKSEPVADEDDTTQIPSTKSKPRRKRAKIAIKTESTDQPDQPVAMDTTSSGSLSSQVSVALSSGTPVRRSSRRITSLRE